MRQVVHAIAQRRQVHAHALEAVEQILAERALRHHRLEVAVGGRDHPHVGRDRARAPDPLELALLEHAQDLGLHGQRHVADLVQEERALLRELEAAGPRPHRAGEGPPLVAEQLGLEQALRDGGAVDRHERPVLPGAEAVDSPRQDFLAGAALAPDQHRQIGGGGAMGHLHHALERLALPDQPLDPARLALAQGLDLLLQPPPVERARDHDLELVHLERLGEEVVGPAGHRVHRGLHACRERSSR